MCPPPPEPIRPVGPLAGDVYVERTGFADRVARRRQRDREDDRDDQGARDEREADEDPEVPTQWFRTESPLKAAGGYDDHGRTGTTDDGDVDTPHVDTTA